jgi:hypothetical protein
MSAWVLTSTETGLGKETEDWAYLHDATPRGTQGANAVSLVKVKVGFVLLLESNDTREVDDRTFHADK